MAKSSVFKARLKVVTVLVDQQLYGSEFPTEGELRLKDFADIVTDIRAVYWNIVMFLSVCTRG